MTSQMKTPLHRLKRYRKHLPRLQYNQIPIRELTNLLLKKLDHRIGQLNLSLRWKIITATIFLMTNPKKALRVHNRHKIRDKLKRKNQPGPVQIPNRPIKSKSQQRLLKRTTVMIFLTKMLEKQVQLKRPKAQLKVLKFPIMLKVVRQNKRTKMNIVMIFRIMKNQRSQLVQKRQLARFQVQTRENSKGLQLNLQFLKSPNRHKKLQLIIPIRNPVPNCRHLRKAELRLL